MLVSGSTIHFRDESVAASLKPKLGRDGCASTHFRDESVAASLKRSVDRTAAASREVFPRRIRRGLIEADRGP